MKRDEFVRVARVDEIPPETGRLVMGPHEKPIALFHVGGAYYAINYICPHMGGPLGEGQLKGYVVACPWHGWTFDVRTGRSDHAGGHCVAAYEVELRGNEIFVGWLK